MYITLIGIIHDAPEHLRVRKDGPTTILETEAQYCYEATSQMPEHVKAETVDVYLTAARLAIGEKVREKLGLPIINARLDV